MAQLTLEEKDSLKQLGKGNEEKLFILYWKIFLQKKV